MSKKNILVLIEKFGQGGAEKAAAILSQAIHESGRYQVYFCSMYKPSGAYHSNEVEKRSLNIEPANSPSQKLGNYWKKFSRLRRLKKELNIDLTISSLWPADWINIFTGREKKIAVIQINILNNEQNAAMVKFRKLVSYVYNRFDKVILVSANLHEEMSGFFKIKKDKLSIIHNPIDAVQLEKNINAPLPGAIESAFSRYSVLIAANRLHDIKNTISLIPIFKKLEAEDLKLAIIGAGQEEASIKAEILSQGLRYTEWSGFDETADVYLLGFQSNIHNLVARSKVFLLPTKGEGFPLALLEAMYCQVPVLVSDCPNGGVFEIMQGSGQYDMNKERTEPERTEGGYLMPVPLAAKQDTMEHWIDKAGELIHDREGRVQEMKAKNGARAMVFEKENLKTKWLGTIESMIG